jgi:hypothetical protein
MKFSGHDSFICKNLWLKKGYDFVQKKDKAFNNELAVVDLGVGKNMVNSINHWLTSFGIIDKSGITEIGHYLFNNNTGKDPYLESISSIWLLHYYLIKTNTASIYNLFFNEFRTNRATFTKQQLADFIIRKLNAIDKKGINTNTINADITVFIRNYLNPEFNNKKIDIEDEFSSLLIDLQLMDTYQSENALDEKVDWYAVEGNLRIELPWQIVLFCILDNDNYGKSIPFTELLNSVNSPGNVFVLNEEGLYNKIEDMSKRFRKEIIYSAAAGIKQLQIKGSLNKWEVLNEYYN